MIRLYYRAYRLFRDKLGFSVGRSLRAAWYAVSGRLVFAYRYFRYDLRFGLGRALQSAWREARKGWGE